MVSYCAEVFDIFHERLVALADTIIGSSIPTHLDEPCKLMPTEKRLKLLMADLRWYTLASLGSEDAVENIIAESSYKTGTNQDRVKEQLHPHGRHSIIFFRIH